MNPARESFLRLTAGEAFEHSGGIVLEAAAWDADSLRLDLRVEVGDDTPSQMWRIHVEHAFDTRLIAEWAEQVYLGRDHPAFVPYREPECDIYFTEAAISAKELLGAASIACAAEVGVWHPISDFLNEGLGLMQGRLAAHGLLGRFPKSAAVRILGELAGTAIRPSLLNERPPVFWDGGAWVAYPESAEVLVFGSSFVVGRGFTFHAA